MDLLPGVRARHVDTDRLRMHVYEAGPESGPPVVLVHGNLSTGRFFEPLLPRHDVMTHFMNQDQHDDPDPEPPAPEQGVAAHGDEERGELDEHESELDGDPDHRRDRRPDLLQQVAEAGPRLDRLVAALGILVHAVHGS